MKRSSWKDAEFRQHVSRIEWLGQSFGRVAPSARCRNRLTPVLRPSRLGGRDETVELFHRSRKLKESARFLPKIANALVEGLDGAPVSRVEVR